MHDQFSSSLAINSPSIPRPPTTAAAISSGGNARPAIAKPAPIVWAPFAKVFPADRDLLLDLGPLGFLTVPSNRTTWEVLYALF